MNAILEMLLELITDRLNEKGISIQAKETLEGIELTLMAMTTKVWTGDDAEYFNKQLEVMNKKLHSIKKEENETS